MGTLEGYSYPVQVYWSAGNLERVLLDHPETASLIVPRRRVDLLTSPGQPHALDDGSARGNGHRPRFVFVTVENVFPLFFPSRGFFPVIADHRASATSTHFGSISTDVERRPLRSHARSTDPEPA